MMHKTYVLEVDSRKHLERLEEALELAGLPTSRRHQEGVYEHVAISFEVNPDVVLEFELGKDTIDEERDDTFWQEDADKIADYYWRQ